MIETNESIHPFHLNSFRGPMFWAFEHRRPDMVSILTQYGVGHDDKDAKGITPVDLLDAQSSYRI